MDCHFECLNGEDCHIPADLAPCVEKDVVHTQQSDAYACLKCDAMTEGHEPLNCAVYARRGPGSCRFIAERVVK
jgi:hypothetical protein